jgi:hypothetical protein
MKLADLERHLLRHSCILYREGGAHSIWFNPHNRKIASVPRHREIKEGTILAACNNSKYHSLKRANSSVRSSGG